MNIQANRVALGDGAWLWRFGEEISVQINEWVMRLYRVLERSSTLKALGVHDVVPSYHAVAVYFSQHVEQRAQIASEVEQHIETLLLADQQPVQKKESGEANIHVSAHQLVVDYHGEDLQRVAQHAGLSVNEVITRHTAVVYRVAMIGFLPHFPYMLGLDQRLMTPRLEQPRVKIPAGAVAIGGAQTGIYPAESPGGWNIIGFTDPLQLTSLKPGDQIRFTAARP